MANYYGSLEAVDCHIPSDIYAKLLNLVRSTRIPKCVSTGHLQYEIVVGDDDTRASALVLEVYFFGRNTSAFVVLFS
eukprot:scaffold4606_cov62-Skeletonema_marinoi.AAC.1